MLISRDSTILFKNYAYLGCGEGNFNISTYYFSTNQEAQAYLDKLLELVELVNNPIPVVDLSKIGERYDFKELRIYSMSDRIEVLSPNDKNIAVLSRVLQKETIKWALTTVLEHLGVKATIII